MIRQHKKMILLTSIITLFPIFIGLLLWNQLPDSLATHWGINNEPNGYASKTFAVFGLPLIMLLGHAVSVIAINHFFFGMVDIRHDCSQVCKVAVLRV